jgi:Ni2+-binding GTPase involved in maturation of urease and hydrogenase
VTTLVLVGGYLGAGKTTLILRAAAILRARGQSAGVILNDQDTGLVDTRLADAHGVASREVAGGCFCCRFADLVDAADALRAWNPDVIFAEPAGSCIDVSATVLQPLKAYHREEYRLAPFTVVVDPGRPPCYLAGNQIAEADLVVATKIDLYPDAALAADYRVNSQTGEGVEPWLDDVLSGRRVAGSRLLDRVDYDVYAKAEAALGWVNLHADLHLRVPASPASVVGPLLDDLDDSLAEIAHLKIFDRAAGGYVKAAICGKGQEPAVQGDLLADSSCEHELVINLRAVADPEALHRAILRALERIEGRVQFRYSKAFRPGYPRPEHRFTSVAP